MALFCQSRVEFRHFFLPGENSEGLNDDNITVYNWGGYAILSTNSKIGGLNLRGYEMENQDMDVENHLRIQLLRRTLNLACTHNCCI